MWNINLDKSVTLGLAKGKYTGFSGDISNEELLVLIQGLIDHGNSSHSFEGFQDSSIKDEYHSFEDLYNIRLAYNVALFNEWGKPIPTGIILTSNPPQQEMKVKYDVHKSWKHHDGEYCFGKEKKWFIVTAQLPSGQISNHYKAEHWDLFKIPETEKALFEFDGHTTHDVINRLKNL